MHVLIVHHDPGTAGLVRALLDEPTGRTDVAVGTTLAGARALLARSRADAVLVADTLPDADARVAVDELLAHDPAMAVVVLTADVDAAAHLLDRGAQDLVVPSRLGRDELRRVVDHAVRRATASRPDADEADPVRLLLEGYTRAVAHDIQRPLATIQMLAQAIRTGDDHGIDPQDLARRIAEQAEQLRDFADVLLADSFVDDRAVRELRLAPLASRALDLSAGRLDAELVAVDVPDDLTVVGREGQLLHALVNLLGNVAEHAGPRPNVAVTARAEDDRVRLFVDDDGPGVPAADRDRILAPGTRLDGAAPGHGLGLAAVVLVARAHGGRVVVDDSPLGGLRVGLDLPRGQGLTASRHSSRSVPGDRVVTPDWPFG